MSYHLRFIEFSEVRFEKVSEFEFETALDVYRQDGYEIACRHGEFNDAIMEYYGYRDNERLYLGFIDAWN